MSHSKIPLIDVTAQNRPLREEILKAFEQILDSSAFILGPEVKAFEEEFKTFTGVPNAISCASGTDALLLPLMAERIGPGDEVLVPSFTFYATAGSVARVGATPVFVDSDESYNISLEDLARKITPKTKAVIPVHLFGLMTDMKKVLEIAKNAKQRIAVIEDCAQSIGASLDGKQSGCWGDYGAFSFYPTKNLGAIGDAGLVTALTQESAEKLQMIRVHGSKVRYYHELIGVNSRLDSIQAAVLRIKLRHLRTYEEKRAAHAALYSKLLHEASLEEQIRLPQVFANRKHVWNQYTIRAKRRDDLRAYLSEKGIGSEIYYPLAMHRQKAFYPNGGAPRLPQCEAMEQEVLSLPMFPELTPDQIERVVAGVADFYRK